MGEIAVKTQLETENFNWNVQVECTNELKSTVTRQEKSLRSVYAINTDVCMWQKKLPMTGRFETAPPSVLVNGLVQTSIYMYILERINYMRCIKNWFELKTALKLNGENGPVDEIKLKLIVAKPEKMTCCMCLSQKRNCVGEILFWRTHIHIHTWTR